MDTSCVEARLSDGTIITVDCKAVETVLDADTWQRIELDWLIYNKPLEYLQAVFSGEIEEYVKGPAERLTSYQQNIRGSIFGSGYRKCSLVR